MNPIKGNESLVKGKHIEMSSLENKNKIFHNT